METPKFIFSHYHDELEEGRLTFFYELVLPTGKLEFSEQVSFPDTSYNLSLLPQALRRSLLESLHLALGISYWKTYCPKEIDTGTIVLSKHQAMFWNTLYTKGLGEFYYKNNIDMRGLVAFPFDGDITVSPITYPRSNRSLIPFGGGKDSLVTAMSLKSHHYPCSLFSVNPTRIHYDLLPAIGVPLVAVKRHIDPALLTLNKKPGVYNGHVPMTAIYLFLAVLAAAVYDYRFVVGSSEESASYGNVRYLGEEINHQWSKSFEYEILFSQYLAQFVTGDIGYFSLLRPYKEIWIAKEFTKYRSFFPYFSSCNRNFALENPLAFGLWCGKCPKCAFMFLTLAAFLPKKDMTQIFGQNLLENTELLSLYRELLGLKDHKPFECIGTPEESVYAFLSVSKNPQYAQDPVIKILRPEVAVSESTDRMKELLFHRSQKHRIPDQFIAFL